MNRKLFAVVLLAIILSLLWRHQNRHPFLLGFVAGLTGKYADLGVDCQRGVELAVLRVNRQGGVNGRKIILAAKDDRQELSQAVVAVKSLLKLQPEVIVGHSTSSMSMATLPFINASSTLLFSPTSSTIRLQNLDDNFLRTCSVSAVSAMAMARYLKEVKKLQSAGVLYDLGNEDYTTPWFDAFQRSFMKAGGNRVLPFTFVSGDRGALLPLVRQAQRENLDVLVMVTNSADAAMLCQQVRKIGWNIPVAMADWAATEQLINLGGRAVEGVIIQQIFNRESKAQAYVEFKKEFEHLYKVEPGFGALHAYDAAMIVFQGLRERGAGETLKQAILRIEKFQGLQYEVHINRFGDSMHPLYMGLVRNGKFVILGDIQ